MYKLLMTVNEVSGTRTQRNPLYKVSIWCSCGDRWHVKSSLAPPLPPLLLRDAGCCGPRLGCGSQTPLQELSVSMCCPPCMREAGRPGRFFGFLHGCMQRLPTHINTGPRLKAVDSLFITAKPTACLGRVLFSRVALLE